MEIYLRSEKRCLGIMQASDKKKNNLMANQNYLDLTSDQEPVVRDRLVNLNHPG